MTYLSDERKVRTFDEDSTLNPTVGPILSYTYKPSSGAIAGSSASAPPRSPIKVNGSQGLQDPDHLTEKKIQALEKELAKLKLANDEAEHKYRSERGMRRAAGQKVESSSRSSNGGKLEEGLIIMMNSLTKREPMDSQVLNTWNKLSGRGSDGRVFLGCSIGPPLNEYTKK